MQVSRTTRIVVSWAIPSFGQAHSTNTYNAPFHLHCITYLPLVLTLMSLTPFGDREAMEHLGERLRRERLRRNQTQGQAAAWAGVSRNTYAKLETGDGSVQLRVLARVLGQFGFVNRLVDCVPEAPAVIDFDAEARIADRQRARPSKPNTPPR